MTQCTHPPEALLRLPSPQAATIIEATDGLDIAAASECIEKRGFCILRGLFSTADIEAVNSRIKRYFAAPAIAGAPGYWKVDHVKKLLNPFTLGGPAIKFLLDKQVIEVVEKVMKSECILAETVVKFDRASSYTYFPLHSDFGVGWSKTSDSKKKLSWEDMLDPVGIGGALYLHPTAEGAFCYCDGTHLLMSPHGQSLSRYPSADQKAILSRRVRCDGQTGDLILFDDRGFHGPDQPASADRTIILLDYYRVDTIGQMQVSPMPIWSSDIASMCATQLRVAGCGATYMVDPLDYAHTKFQKNSFYSTLSWLVSNAYYFSHLKNKLKSYIRRGE
tara:strand:- start:853 stop:1851 length:999 start_codon:yes stop_codon:yes gene_type:complete